MNQKVVTETKVVKFLGIHIDERLNWEAHIKHIRNSLQKSLGLIFHVSSFLPINTLILLYNALINSKLIYCLEAWGNAPKTHLNKLLIIQKKLLRIIYKKPRQEHCAPLFKKSHILPIFQLYQLRISFIAHSYFYNTHTRQSPYTTRRSLYDLPLPPSTSSAGHRQPTYRAAETWNNIPIEIRKIKSISYFRVVLKRHLLDSLT